MWCMSLKCHKSRLTGQERWSGRCLESERRVQQPVYIGSRPDGQTQERSTCSSATLGIVSTRLKHDYCRFYKLHHMISMVAEVTSKRSVMLDLSIYIMGHSESYALRTTLVGYISESSFLSFLQHVQGSGTGQSEQRGTFDTEPSCGAGALGSGGAGCCSHGA